MRTAIRWLRTSYIVGAVADGVVAVLMLVPGRMGETAVTYPMGLGASLMFGWAGLLLWANIRPVERKGVLLITIFPVIVGLIVSGIWAMAAGIIPAEQIIPSSIVGVLLICLMGYSYYLASSSEGLDN